MTIHISWKSYAFAADIAERCECQFCHAFGGIYRESGTVYRFVFLFPFMAPKDRTYQCTSCSTIGSSEAMNAESRGHLNRSITTADPLRGWSRVNFYLLVAMLWTLWVLPTMPLLCGLSLWTTYGRFARGTRRSFIAFSIWLSVLLQLGFFAVVLGRRFL